jgi:hypothetical protein
MKFETMLPKLRAGGKFNKPGMGDAHITIVKVAMNRAGTIFADKLIITSPTGGTRINFTFTNEDVMSEDWTDCEPIVKVHMYTENFKIHCPGCSREFDVGPKWELRVGDVHKCTCGNKLLLAPPEEYDNTSSTEQNNASTTLDQWPKA